MTPPSGARCVVCGLNEAAHSAGGFARTLHSFQPSPIQSSGGGKGATAKVEVSGTSITGQSPLQSVTASVAPNPPEDPPPAEGCVDRSQAHHLALHADLYNSDRDLKAEREARERAEAWIGRLYGTMVGDGWGEDPPPKGLEMYKELFDGTVRILAEAGSEKARTSAKKGGGG